MTLQSFLLGSLSTLPGKERYSIRIVRSRPQRSYSCFALATDPNVKVYREEVLIILSCSLQNPVDHSDLAKIATPDSHAGVEEKVQQESSLDVPIYGLEVHIYTVPMTSTSLVYISKVDSTGLLEPPHAKGAGRTITRAFLSYIFSHPPRGAVTVRVHVFARSQSQYLFPGSGENTNKNVLDDKTLCRWWKSVLGESISKLPENVQREVKKWYILPGLSYLEATRFVPDDVSQGWIYGHPYTVVPSPVIDQPSSGDQNMQSTLADMIPCFPDDPKSRFVNSLSSSRLNPAGERNDWDEEMLALLHEGVGKSSTKREAVEKEREKERKRLIEGVPGGVEEFWERLAWRQELCDGHLGGFFVVVRTLVDKEGQAILMTPHLLSLPQVQFIPVWSHVHNLPYEKPSLPMLLVEFQRWCRELKAITLKEGWQADEAAWEIEAEGFINVNNGTAEKDVDKRKDPPASIAVNKLVPRKKKKVS